MRAARPAICSGVLPSVNRVGLTTPGATAFTEIMRPSSSLASVAVQLGEVRTQRSSETRTLFAEDTGAQVLDCAARLMPWWIDQKPFRSCDLASCGSSIIGCFQASMASLCDRLQLRAAA